PRRPYVCSSFVVGACWPSVQILGFSSPLLTLKVPKHARPRDPVLLHQRRDGYAAAVFIPQRADLAGRQLPLAPCGPGRGGSACTICPGLPASREGRHLGLDCVESVCQVCQRRCCCLSAVPVVCLPGNVLGEGLSDNGRQRLPWCPTVGKLGIELRRQPDR